MSCKARVVLLAGIILCHMAPAMAQQKGQWVPRQYGLNAGVIPDPGITYANMAVNYSASQLNDSNGNPILQNVTATYSFWVDENIVYYVPNHKFLGGYFMPYIAVNIANGELWFSSLSTATSIQPRLVQRDARLCSAVRGRCGFRSRRQQSRGRDRSKLPKRPVRQLGMHYRFPQRVTPRHAKQLPERGPEPSPHTASACGRLTGNPEVIPPEPLNMTWAG